MTNICVGRYGICISQASSLDVFSMPLNALKHLKIEFYKNFTEFCHIFTELCDKVFEFYSFCSIFCFFFELFLGHYNKIWICWPHGCNNNSKICLSCIWKLSMSKFLTEFRQFFTEFWLRYWVFRQTSKEEACYKQEISTKALYIMFKKKLNISPNERLELLL